MHVRLLFSEGVLRVEVKRPKSMLSWQLLIASKLDRTASATAIADAAEADSSARQKWK